MGTSSETPLCFLAHHTLRKLTLPHDAAWRVVLQQERNQRETKGFGFWGARPASLLWPMLMRGDVMWRHMQLRQLSLVDRVQDCRWNADPAEKRRDGDHEEQSENRFGSRRRTSEFPAAQVGSLGHAKKRAELAKRRLGESLRKEVSDVHIRRNITHAK